MPTITFKTLAQEAFTMDLQPEQKISEIKEQIEKLRGDEVALQKLLYNGKVLKDEDTVESCEIDPARFVVLMVTKKKVEAPAPAASGDPAPATTSEPAKTDSTPIPAESAAPAEKLEPVPAAEQGSTTSLTAEQQSALTAVMDMGYTREQALGALRAALFNANAAVDFLLSGNPDEFVGNMGAFGGGAAAEGGGRSVSINDVPQIIDAPPAAEGLSGADRFALVRDLPQFDELRSMVHSNPSILPQLLEQISQLNPELMQLIQENQMEFIRMLMEQPGGAGGASEGEAVPEAHAGRQVIAISQEDNEAINRLKAMGFPESLVVEAFIACDKNEDLAVNYILARMDEAANAFGQ